MNDTILRFDECEPLLSNLDPIEDLLNLLATLKSKEYTKKLLIEKYAFSKWKELNETIKLISLHTDVAIWLARQWLSWPHETSFLPLYYSCLNLFKIQLLFLWKKEEFKKNRWHGASYDEDSSNYKNPLKEEISIYEKGTIPLIYYTITWKKIPKAEKGYKVKLDDLYSNITSISWEYNMIVWKNHKLLHKTIFTKDDKDGHYFKIIPFDSEKPIPAKKLTAYSWITLIKKTNKWYYVSKKVKWDYELAKKELNKSIQRDLLNPYLQGSWFNSIHCTKSKYTFNEEFSILLAYFHMSNVVRYNSEHLSEIMNSKYWAIILPLKTHGYYRFLCLMWWNYNKKCFDI